MKKHIFLVLFAISLSFSISCKKEVDEPQLPILTTSEVTNVKQYSAKCGGEISSDGGTSVFERGVCWDTISNPTILDDKTSDGEGKGSFSSSLSSLIPNTKYYIRAFAKNSVGVAYGNQIVFTTDTIDPYAVGTNYQGGTIAYIFHLGDAGYVSGEIHGLIVAPTDFNSIADWGCVGDSIIMNNSQEIGAGKQNTINIVNNCNSTTSAAYLCENLVVNGYDDWYLPSKNELAQICLNRFKIGNFESNFYWTSSDDGSLTNAWSQSFGSGSKYFDPKSNLMYVRAVRNF